MSMTQQYKC